MMMSVLMMVMMLMVVVTWVEMMTFRMSFFMKMSVGCLVSHILGLVSLLIVIGLIFAILRLLVMQWRRFYRCGSQANLHNSYD